MCHPSGEIAGGKKNRGSIRLDGPLNSVAGVAIDLWHCRTLGSHKTFFFFTRGSDRWEEASLPSQIWAAASDRRADRPSLLWAKLFSAFVYLFIHQMYFKKSSLIYKMIITLIWLLFKHQMKLEVWSYRHDLFFLPFSPKIMITLLNKHQLSNFSRLFPLLTVLPWSKVSWLWNHYDVE